jgi:hypothetical protein
MVKRLFAIGFMFACVSVAWKVLAGAELSSIKTSAYEFSGCLPNHGGMRWSCKLRHSAETGAQSHPNAGNHDMRWTIAHPAAVLPLRRLCPRFLSCPALIVDSVAPDIG